MKKPSVIIDTVLTFAAIFLLCAVVAGYFTSDKAYTVPAALIAALAVTFFTSRLSAKRRLPKKRKRKLGELLNKFIFSTPAYAYDHVLDAIKSKHAVAEQNGFIVSGGTAFYVKIDPEKIGFSTLAERYSAAAEIKAERLVILSAYGADTQTAETARLLSAPKTEIWDFEQVYRLLAHLGHAPTETLVLTRPRKKLGAAIRGALSRENARGYLFTAIVTLLFARFMPYSVLYVAVSAVAVTLSVLCRLRVAERIASKRTN